MSNEFMRSNSQLDALISECTDPEKIREITKAHMEKAGFISRERGADYGVNLIRQVERGPSAAPVVSLPAVDSAPPTCLRIFYVGNDRYELQASDESILDARESAIRSALGQR